MHLFMESSIPFVFHRFIFVLLAFFCVPPFFAQVTLSGKWKCVVGDRRVNEGKKEVRRRKFCRFIEQLKAIQVFDCCT